MAERSLDDLLGLGESQLWEVFHENSKNGKTGLALSSVSSDDTQKRMAQFHESLPYPGYPVVELPAGLPTLGASLEQALLGRCSVRQLARVQFTLPQVASLLHHAYGMTRPNTFVPFPPELRPIPSAGALYPLEVYFHSAHVEGLGAGLYHYSPKGRCLHLLDGTDRSDTLRAATLYPEYVESASLVLFVTAQFERTTWKYGNRGYRYALLEAGHLAQNVSLVAGALGLGAFALGGFIDREIDAFLGLDGVTHSTVLMLCVGGG
jgi:SagB-type dehydrogenase family enzyme